MSRYNSFTFRVNREERRMLATLAKHLQRSQSDAFRLLVREAVAQLEPGSSQTKDGGRAVRAKH